MKIKKNPLSLSLSKTLAAPKARLGLKSERRQIFRLCLFGGFNLTHQPPRALTGNLREPFNLQN